MSLKHRNPPSIFTQIIDLFLIEMTNWRWAWRTSIIVGVLTPVMIMVLLGIFAKDSQQETFIYILTGNIVLSLMIGTMDNVQSHFVFMRFRGTFDYFATLPVKRYLLILALVCAFLFLSIPSLVATVLMGSIILHVRLNIHPLIILIVPIISVSLASIGAYIGIRARTPQEAGASSRFIALVMFSLGPVVIPPDRLPLIIYRISKLSPATYAASALRQVLIGPVSMQLFYDISILMVLGITLLWIVGRRISWHTES